MTPPRIVIVGAGMAGLAAAWECHRRGLPSVVLEAAPHVGGVVRTHHGEGGLLLDGGADAFLVTKPGAITLCREVGVEDELIQMLPPRGAFIQAGGHFHPLPEGGAFGVPVRARAFLTSRLLSWPGKLRVAMEPFVRSARWDDDHDESAGAFFRRRFGDEMAERIAEPLLGGIHAGGLDTLSARAVLPQFVTMEAEGRSVWRTLRREGRQVPGGVFRSFRTGMGRLPRAVADALPPGTVRTGVDVTTLTQTDGGLLVRSADGATLEADIVLLAVPAWRAGALLGATLPHAPPLCVAVPYVSSATVLMAYPSSAFPAPLRGSGYVIADRRPDDPVMALTWVTGKWPGRAEPGTTLLRVFFAGAGHEHEADADDETLTAHGHRHLTRWWHAQAAPQFARVFRWTRSSPQHVVGHPARVRLLQAQLDTRPGLGVAGSGFRAIGIPDVVADARAEVGRLIERWQQR